MFHIVLSEDLLKSDVYFKGFINNLLDSEKTKKSTTKRNTQNYSEITDIINRDKVFYFLDTTESLSSSSSSSIETISSSEEDTSFKDYTDDSSLKRRTNHLLPINDYNIQNYYNIQNRRYSYDMTSSSPRSNHFNKFKGLNSSQSQSQLNQNIPNVNNINNHLHDNNFTITTTNTTTTTASTINNNNNNNNGNSSVKSVEAGQGNSFLTPYSPIINEYHNEGIRRSRRFSYQSTNDSLDQKRTGNTNSKLNKFPSLIIDSADHSEEEEEEEEEGNALDSSYSNQIQPGKIHSRISKILPSPYEPKSLSKRRALTMPDLTFNHLGLSNSSLSSMGHGLIRVNSTTINRNMKTIHPLSKTTYLIMEVNIRNEKFLIINLRNN